MTTSWCSSCWAVAVHKHTTALHMCDTYRVWWHDKAEHNFFISLLLLARLFVLVSGTHSPAPCAPQLHTPACMAAVVSCFKDEATSDQWDVVRTVKKRGGNSPPISRLSLPGNRSSLREEPPCHAVWMNTKQKLSPTGELHESLLVFLDSILFDSRPPSLFFIHGWRTALHFGRTGKKRTQRNKTVKVWELFLVPFFPFQDHLSVLTLLTQVFVHLWCWISGSASYL